MIAVALDKKEKQGDGAGGTPGWMVTFSDLATLLLTFFVLLISMSSMDDRSFKTLFSNFTSSCGILFFKEYEEIYRAKDTLIEGLFKILHDRLVIKKVNDPPDQVLSENEQDQFKEFANTLTIEEIRNGMKFVFGQRLLYDSGSAKIKEEAKPALRKIARFLSTSSYRVYVDGHTDNIPIYSAKYATNEDLSLARAFNLMDFLVKDGNVLPTSLCVGGYGEYRPVASNNTPQGRERNRRVELIIKNQEYF